MNETIEAAPEVVQTTVEAVATVTENVAQETKSMLHIDEITSFFSQLNKVKIITSIITILLFYIVYRIIKKIVKKQAFSKLQMHTAVLLNKVMTYVFWVLMIMYIMSLFGVKLSAIWGAAGVAGSVVSTRGCFD